MLNNTPPGTQWDDNTRSTLMAKGSFVATLDAMEEIRKGNVSSGLERIENHCYSQSVLLLSNPEWTNKPTLRALVPDLIAYRQRFASDTSQWSRTEIQLEALLSKHGRAPTR